jgi:hypothetical protein
MECGREGNAPLAGFRCGTERTPQACVSLSHSGLKEQTMPAKSKKQQMAAGAALSAKRGERSKSSLKGASRGMVKSMSESELERMASAKRKKLPTRSRKSG